MVSPQAVEAGRVFFGRSNEQLDPLEIMLAENTRALEAAILHNLAQGSGLSDEEFLDKHPDQTFEPYTLH